MFFLLSLRLVLQLLFRSYALSLYRLIRSLSLFTYFSLTIVRFQFLSPHALSYRDFSFSFFLFLSFFSERCPSSPSNGVYSNPLQAMLLNRWITAHYLVDGTRFKSTLILLDHFLKVLINGWKVWSYIYCSKLSNT